MKVFTSLNAGQNGALRSLFRLSPLAAMLVCLSFPASAGNSIYNMNQLLAEPHPFAAASLAPTPSPSVGPAPAPASTSRSENAPGASKSNEEKDSDSDLELDDLNEEFEEDEKLNDPLEPMNRVIFSFNGFVNDYLLAPVAKGYNAVFPEFVREAISSFLSNLNEPVVLANDVLQGEFKRGLNTGTRLVVNSTVGIGGLIDVAEKLGFEKHSEDFGQTLAVWGVGEGFYLVLPLLGASSPRDAFGKHFVDSYFDPLGYYLDNTDWEEWGYARTGLQGIVTYAEIVDELETLKESSIDFYGAIRSLYRQKRAADIANQSQKKSTPELDFNIE